MLGVLKITQDNPAKVWKYVPLQDFSSTSDIDWSKPISDIDRQLYAKYKLDAHEIDFIEARIKPMSLTMADEREFHTSLLTLSSQLWP